LESLNLVKIVVLEKQRRREPINSDYKLARTLEEDYALKLVLLKVTTLEVPSSGLLQLITVQISVGVTSSTRRDL
jgi:hypothetical protein